MYTATKRTLDILGAGIALTLFSPILLPVALVIWRRMGSPVLFRHPRPGFRERRFECLKFRTMAEARDENGQLLSDEERLTGLGRFLRRTSLDELPQFWNVLKGEMTLVGPRPLEMRYLPRYNAEQKRRHQVKPGITGWAQVNGRNAIDWDRKFELDLWYVDHAGFWLDIRILALTIWRVVSADGISQAGHATASEFWGTEPAQHA